MIRSAAYTEPATVERAPQERVCGACYATAPTPMSWTVIGGVGTVWLCDNPLACRQRAQQRGIWCVI